MLVDQLGADAGGESNRRLVERAAQNDKEFLPPVDAVGTGEDVRPDSEGHGGCDVETRQIPAFALHESAFWI
ncbi:MAG TPA: hypothetical protein VGP95_18030 [Gemmatimonadaceae bacterium]|nr:hypothetical protein [Gemmatimonadaceae bacterium]